MQQLMIGIQASLQNDFLVIHIIIHELLVYWWRQIEKCSRFIVLWCL